MKAYEIKSYKATKESTPCQTKFGGQPDWLTSAQWPVSEAWGGRPMKFICQIRLDEIYNDFTQPSMAYVFLTQPADMDDDFFDPDIIFPYDGENAVIIQPNGIIHDWITIQKLTTGPTVDDSKVWIPELVEKEENEPSDFDTVDVDKFGGIPAFFQANELNKEDNRLLMQLHTNWLPFYINAGGAPTMFVMLNASGEKGYISIDDM